MDAAIRPVAGVDRGAPLALAACSAARLTSNPGPARTTPLLARTAVAIGEVSLSHFIIL